jgi:LPXTG-site transpeptidase (sortase) family protein
MSDQRKPRAPRPRSQAGRPASRRTATTAPAKQVAPPRRARIYRIPVLGTIAYVIWPPRTGRRSIPRRILSWTAVVVAVLGIGMAAYPIAGEHYPPGYRQAIERLIEWSNVLSDLQTNRIQGRLAQEFATLRDPRLAKEGEPITRLEIPKLHVDVLVVQGTSLSALRAGAGHYPGTPLPGNRGNVAIAGHRTTYGRPFNGIDELNPGDLIILTTPVGRFSYKVDRPPWVTDPYDWSVTAPSNDYLLTLTSCHPKGSAAHRIIVRAKLAKTEALKAPAKHA